MTPFPNLDRFVEIQSPTDSTDAIGAPTVTFATLARVWCKHVHQGGREFRMAGALMSETSDLFTIRFRSDVTTHHRLLFEEEYYDIIDVGEGEGRRVWTVIQAKGSA